MAVCDIVIPYFQREPGILAKALRSIAEQSFGDYRALVVDDGSPCPPEPELEDLSPGDRDRIAIIAKPNGGVSSARNAGLAAVAEDTRMVAFLDSDDAWTPDHLARAHAAIVDAGADVFWDALPPDERFGSFRAPSVMIPDTARRPEPRVERGYAVANLHKVLCGQWFRHMHLSCTAISARLARQVRFREDLNLGEDFAFYCRCGDVAELSVASDAPGCARGAGDNLWHGTDFFDVRTAREKLVMMKLLKALRGSPRLDESDRDVLALRIQRAREQFYWIQARRMKSRRSPSLGLWADWLIHDPALLGAAASLVLKTHPSRGETIVPGDEV